MWLDYSLAIYTTLGESIRRPALLHIGSVETKTHKHTVTLMVRVETKKLIYWTFKLFAFCVICRFGGRWEQLRSYKRLRTSWTKCHKCWCHIGVSRFLWKKNVSFVMHNRTFNIKLIKIIVNRKHKGLWAIIIGVPSKMINLKWRIAWQHAFSAGENGSRNRWSGCPAWSRYRIFHNDHLQLILTSQ